MTDADDQHSCRPGVEGAGMTDTSFTETSTQHRDHIVAGDTGRFVHNADPVHGGRPASRHRSVCFPPPVIAQDFIDALSSTKSIIGSKIQNRRLLCPNLARDRRLQSHTMFIECLDDGVVPIWTLKRVEIDVRAIQLIIHVDSGHRHELKSFIADSRKLIGDDLAKRLSNPHRSRVALGPATTGAPTWSLA